jgi:zinc transport system substrate-binding protein
VLSRIVLFSGALIVAVGLLAGCGSGGPRGPGGHRDTIVAAFYPIAYAVEQIAGDLVDVRNLTPAGAEPHDLELTPGDVRAVHDASLVFYLGDGFMPGLETAVQERHGRSADLLERPRREEGDGRGPPDDPHVWLDPVRYAAMVRLIGSALGDDVSAGRLARRLARLDRQYRRGLAHCARRQIVTSHAAFGYLATRYGLEQIPLEGLTPEAEPSAKDLAHLVDVVRASGATTVFSEPLVSPKLAQTVAREGGVGTAVLDPVEGLSDDEIAAGADYFSVMRSNLAALQKALGCTT